MITSLSYTNNNNKSVNQRSVFESYSDGPDNNKINDENINGNISIVPPQSINEIKTTIELPNDSKTVFLEDGIVNACLITDNKNRAVRNGSSCIANSRSNYAPINYFTPVATLTQSTNGKNVQPNVTDLIISNTLDKFALYNNNNNNNNNTQPVPIENKPIEVATKNVIKEEIVENVQKNTTDVIKTELANKADNDKIEDISNKIGETVATHVENVLNNNDLPNKTTSQEQISELVKSCVFDKLKEIYSNQEDALNASINITNQTLNEVDPEKYKLLIEIATNQLDVKKNIVNVASTIKQVLENSSNVNTNGANTVMTNVDVKNVVNTVNSNVDVSSIVQSIKDVKNALEPEVFVTHGLGNKIVVMVEDNNVIQKTAEKITKQINNEVVENFSQIEKFTQHSGSYANLSNNITLFDNNQNKIKLHDLVGHIVEHMTEQATVVTPLENQPTTDNQINQASVSVNKDTIVVVPQTNNCDCSEDQLKEMCAKISLDTGAKKVEVEVTKDEVKPIVVTVEKPNVSVESTVKTTLNAVNEQISKTQVATDTKLSTPTYDNNSNSNSNSCVDLIIFAIGLYLLYVFLNKK